MSMSNSQDSLVVALMGPSRQASSCLGPNPQRGSLLGECGTLGLLGRLELSFGGSLLTISMALSSRG